MAVVVVVDKRVVDSLCSACRLQYFSPWLLLLLLLLLLWFFDVVEAGFDLGKKCGFGDADLHNPSIQYTIGTLDHYQTNR